MSNYGKLRDNATIGVNSRTGMVHYAIPRGPEGQLEQVCGVNRSQHVYLSGPSDVDDPNQLKVTCKRCLNTYGPDAVQLAPKPAKKAVPAKEAGRRKAKGFAAQGKGHADYTKRIMAERTPQGKASVVVELFNGLKGWSATLEGKTKVLARSKDGRYVVVAYPPEKGHPIVRTHNNKDHTGNRRPNVSAAYLWAQSK